MDLRKWMINELTRLCNNCRFVQIYYDSISLIMKTDVGNKSEIHLGIQNHHKATSILFKSRVIYTINLFYGCHGCDIYCRAPFSHVLCKLATARFYTCYFIAVLEDSFLIKGPYTEWGNDILVSVKHFA